MTRLFLAMTVCLLSVGPVTAETRLLMFEQAGCIYCAQWHAEVGPGYPMSTEGRTAPLMPLHLRAELPDGIVLNSRPAITPTFVLVVDGEEKGRIEGYPGAHFFWPMLAQLLHSPEN